MPESRLIRFVMTPFPYAIDVDEPVILWIKKLQLPTSRGSARPFRPV